MNKSNVNKIYDRNYAQNYDRRFLLNDRSKIDTDFEQETIAQLLNEIGENPRWLDVACGTGYFLSCFPEIERSGLDISPAMLETARQANPNIPLVRGDYRDKQLQWEGKWDLVSCMWLAYGYVESLSEFDRVVENFANWTSDRGICFVPFTAPQELATGELHIPYECKNLYNDAGFIRFEGVLWTWVDEEMEKQHISMLAPQLEYMLALFGRYFEKVEVIEYPPIQGARRKALVARQKKQKTDKKQTDFNLLKLVRAKEWWLYKIAPLLTITYAETLLLQLPPLSTTLITLTVLISIASVAAYGYLLNDICDIESDRQANKPNAAANLQPWQRLLLGLVFVSSGFALPLLTHLSALPIALLCANYLVPTLYSAPPLRLKERGIWGILSDAAGAHLIPTLFVAAAFLSHAPDPPRNVLIFTGLAAAHAFFVGLRGILLHQLWDRQNDARSNTTTFVSQRDPETVRRWINRFVFPIEIALLGSVAVLLSRSSPSLIPVLVAYVIFTVARLKVTKTPLNPSPPAGQNIVPHDLYEVWLPLTLATLLASRDPYYLGFVVLMLVLFFPAVKLRTIELVGILKAAISPDDETEEAIAMPKTNVVPLTPEMQQQLETEGYVVLENFLTPDELEDLRAFDRSHSLPEDLVTSGKPPISLLSSDISYRQKVEGRFKMIAAPKIATILPGYRTLFCPWTRRRPSAKTESLNLHQDPSFTDESMYRCLGIWTPLSDVEIEHSCICLVKGSHALPPRKRAYTRPGLPFDEEVQSYVEKNYLTYMPLKAGQAILFDRRLVHGSSPNTSNVERVAPTCLIIIPENAPLYLCHQESGEEDLELYEVKDDFYESYVFGGGRPHGKNVKLIGSEAYKRDTLSLARVTEILDPFYSDRITVDLKTQPPQTQSQQNSFQIQMDNPSMESQALPVQSHRSPQEKLQIAELSTLSLEMQRQLEMEGYVILEDFLSLTELKDLQQFYDTHAVPEDIASRDVIVATMYTANTSYRKEVSSKIERTINSKIKTIIPGYRALFGVFFEKKTLDSEVGLHQDASFTDEFKYKALSIWVALQDTDMENGGLFFAKGSHKLNIQKRPYHKHIYIPPYDDACISKIKQNYLTPVPLKAGQAAIFDKRLFHGSYPNKSETSRVSASCFNLIPESAPLYCCYMESTDAGLVEVYQVPDDFYNNYILGDKPSGDGVKLIKTEPYTYDPLTPELIAEKLGPLHRDRAIPPLKTELPQARTEDRETRDRRRELKAQQHRERLMSIIQERSRREP